MSTPTFRSLVCSRARPELFKTGQALSNYFREFSTTQSLADDASGGPPSGRSNNERGRGGNARQRGRAAASAINTMVKNRGPSPNGPRPGGGGGTGAGAAPKVLDVRSLPRGLGRGGRGGGFRGRGGGFQGGRGDAGAAPGATTGTNRFAPGGRGGARGRGGAAGARGRGRGGGAGVRGGRGGAGGEKREARGPGGSKSSVDPFERMDEAETALDVAVRFRQRESYTPGLDVAELLEYAPAVPTSATGRRAAVMESLQTMGGGTSDLIGAASGYVPGGAATGVEDRVQRDGLAFFATPESRAWAEDHGQEAKKRADQAAEGEEEAATAATAATADKSTPMFAAAGEAVQKVVLRAVVEGAIETPRFATDVHGIVRAQHVRGGSYGPAATAMFEKKLQSLVGAPKPAVAAKPAAATKPGKAAKTKEAKA